MEKRSTIVLVLSEGNGFGFRDVELIAKHINSKWQDPILPRIICFCKNVSFSHSINNLELIPFPVLPGVFSKLTIFSPAIEEYRPFLYVDLDTAVYDTIEKVINAVPDESKFITLEDFYDKGRLATGLVWCPANSDKVKKIWDMWDENHMKRFRMDFYIRSVVQADYFWQRLTNSLVDFKPRRGVYVTQVPEGTSLVCFHGKPKIFESEVEWVKEYRDGI